MKYLRIGTICGSDDCHCEGSCFLEYDAVWCGRYR